MKDLGIKHECGESIAASLVSDKPAKAKQEKRYPRVEFEGKQLELSGIPIDSVGKVYEAKVRLKVTGIEQNTDMRSYMRAQVLSMGDVTEGEAEKEDEDEDEDEKAEKAEKKASKPKKTRVSDLNIL